MGSDFLKKLEKAMSGRAREYSTLNFLKNPFLPTTDLSEAQSLFVQRPELDDFLGSFSDMMNEQLRVITISGSKGIGKTHFLFFIYDQIKKISEKRSVGEVRLIKNKHDFTSFRNEYIGSVQEKKNYLILIDEAENLWNDDQSRNDLITIINVSNVKVVWSWNIFSWKRAKNDTNTLPKTKMILLDKMSNNLIFQVLDSRIHYFSINKEKSSFSQPAVRLILRISNGVPYSAVNHAERILELALKSKLNFVDEKFIYSYIEENRIPLDNRVTQELVQSLDGLTKSEKKILKIVYEYSTSYNRTGITATQVAKSLNMATPNSFNYLKGLMEKKKIVDRTQIGREVFYHIKGEILPWVERILQGQKTLDFEDIDPSIVTG